MANSWEIRKMLSSFKVKMELMQAFTLHDKVMHFLVNDRTSQHRKLHIASKKLHFNLLNAMQIPKALKHYNTLIYINLI